MPHKNPRKARPGNKNSVKGPRVGRRAKPVTPHVAAPALPQPRAIKAPPRKGHPKTAGKDFAPGTNSHDGTVFRRTADMLPRGNVVLFAKIVYHDVRERLYQRHVNIVDKGTNREVLALTDWLANRIDGLPTKHVETTRRRESTFVFTTKDGTEVPALPKKVGEGATRAAASAEDQVILGLQPVRL